MKMMIVIIKDQDADALTQHLTASNYRVTRVASTGGFLRSGVVTLLMGLEDSQVDAAIDMMRTKLGPASEEGRGTVFVVPVDHFEQI
jgi:uncharacterized protein YaaQ